LTAFFDFLFDKLLRKNLRKSLVIKELCGAAAFRQL